MFEKSQTNFKPCPHIESNTTNPNTIFKISIYYTKTPKNVKIHSIFWKISKVSKIHIFKKIDFKMISVLWLFLWPAFGGPKILVYICWGPHSLTSLPPRTHTRLLASLVCTRHIHRCIGDVCWGMLQSPGAQRPHHHTATAGRHDLCRVPRHESWCATIKVIYACRCHEFVSTGRLVKPWVNNM